MTSPITSSITPPVTPFKKHWGFVPASDLASFVVLSQTKTAPALNPCILTMGLDPTDQGDGTALVVRMPSFSVYKELCEFDKHEGGLKATIHKGHKKVEVSSLANTRQDIRPSVTIALMMAKFAPNEGLLELYNADKEYWVALSMATNQYIPVEVTVGAATSFTSSAPASYLKPIKDINKYKTIAPDTIRSIWINADRVMSEADMGKLGYMGLIREYKSRFGID